MDEEPTVTARKDGIDVQISYEPGGANGNVHIMFDDGEHIDDVELHVTGGASVVRRLIERWQADSSGEV